MRKLFFIIGWLFMGINLSAQTNKAVYSFKIEKNSITGSTSLGDEVNPLSEKNSFYLYFDNKASYFTSENTENKRPDMSDALAGSYYPIKYNFNDNQFGYNVEFDKFYYVLEENIPEWTITNEIKNISGYDCVKAVGKLKYVNNPNKYNIIEAWFAPELPFSTGPKFYVGLPGLIVYVVRDYQHIFKLEGVKFNDDNMDLNKVKISGVIINQDEYAKMLNKEFEN